MTHVEVSHSVLNVIVVLSIEYDEVYEAFPLQIWRPLIQRIEIEYKINTLILINYEFKFWIGIILLQLLIFNILLLIIGLIKITNIACLGVLFAIIIFMMVHWWFIWLDYVRFKLFISCQARHIRTLCVYI